ncbi:hypothetical protein [Allopontixanthobacter sp.]|uniref:hypothetical protein n=1 Tax=Allopontixanthobacter sp. TaxID=2906452 RepID=UPI002ABA6722|nr:hypothetical protein [Allopontixanthobacter sp.]MDZ4307479.1 hypothetical protein [Allopontixanthobacter sp.]
MSVPDSGVPLSDHRRYLRAVPKLESPWSLARWALTNPFRSYTGGKAIEAYVRGRPPAAWAAEMAGQDVLIVGSGPSLDRVGDDFFARFAASIHINFAIRRSTGPDRTYFFTTDLGPIGGLLESFGDQIFLSLGADRCIYAPVFLDQWHMMTDEGRALFTMLRHDRAGWRTQNTSLGSLPVPYTLRYHPSQPDWDRFELPPPGRTLPVLDHSSALTAIIFAAMNGARRIGMIGCDFSAGERAEIARGFQELPGPKFFAGAAGELARIQSALARRGIEVTNHSHEI